MKIEKRRHLTEKYEDREKKTFTHRLNTPSPAYLDARSELLRDGVYKPDVQVGSVYPNREF